MKYSKAIGAFVGSLIGLLAAFNITVPPEYTTVLNVAVPSLTALAATWFAPKNAE